MPDRSRPPLGVRVTIGLLAVGVLVFNVALMLSDRAPRALRRVFGDQIDRLSDRIDARGRAALDQASVESDSVVHVGVWAVAAVLVGGAIWRWRWLPAVLLAVFAASIVVEFAQGRFTDGRRVEWRDVAFNGVGVLVGGVVLVVAYGAWDALRRPTGRDATLE